MWRSPEIAHASGIAFPFFAPMAGWPPQVTRTGPQLQAAVARRGVGIEPPYPPRHVPVPFADPAVMRMAPSYQDANIATFSLLDPQGPDAVRLPQEGLLSGLGAGFGHPEPPWADEAPPFGLFWRISDDADDGQPHSHGDLYPEFRDFRKSVSDWRARQVKDIIEHNGRAYLRRVWELIDEVATATPETAVSLHGRIDALLQHDHTTRNIFHKYLEDRLSGDAEEDTRSLLLDEASLDRMSARQLRDSAARLLARQVMTRQLPGLELLGVQSPPEEAATPSREQIESVVTPAMIADLRHALDAYLEIRRQYNATRAASHEYPVETMRGSLVQMNSLTGEALQELLKLGLRAEGRLLEAGINFRAPTGYRFPDGSLDRYGSTPENIEVKSISGRSVRSQVEKDEWAEKELGIRRTLMKETDILRMVRRILGDPEEGQ
jgi:hypothetical protein